MIYHRDKRFTETSDSSKTTLILITIIVWLRPWKIHRNKLFCLLHCRKFLRSWHMQIGTYQRPDWLYGEQPIWTSTAEIWERKDLGLQAGCQQSWDMSYLLPSPVSNWTFDYIHCSRDIFITLSWSGEPAYNLEGVWRFGEHARAYFSKHSFDLDQVLNDNDPWSVKWIDNDVEITPKATRLENCVEQHRRKPAYSDI